MTSIQILEFQPLCYYIHEYRDKNSFAALTVLADEFSALLVTLMWFRMPVRGSSLSQQRLLLSSSR
jgi:hypothetical protein